MSVPIVITWQLDVIDCGCCPMPTRYVLMKVMNAATFQIILKRARDADVFLSLSWAEFSCWKIIHLIPKYHLSLEKY